jgi:prepilin peptidase CpaA
MTIDLCWLTSLTAISLFICCSDVQHRQIENKSVWCVALLCLSILVINQQYQAIMFTSIILALGFGLFLTGVIAAGDIKLLAAFSLAIKPEYLLSTLGLILLSGGIVAGIYLTYGVLTDLKRVRQEGIPYAIPICLGCLFGIAASL